MSAIACASRGSARRMVMARGVMLELCHGGAPPGEGGMP
jgi:hypothetical protein